MKFVFVHGRGQHEHGPAQLKRAWITALLAGANAAGMKETRTRLEREVLFPYYACLLPNTPLQEAEATTRGRARRRDTRSGTQMSTEEKARRILNKFEVEVSQQHEPANTRISVTGCFSAATCWIHRMLSGIDGNVPGASAKIIEKALHDVARYLSLDQTRTAVIGAVTDAIAKAATADEVTVVAHSLGSVVALESLHRMALKVKNVRLVTVGSPLAVRAIRENVANYLRQHAFSGWLWPTNVVSWSNAADRRDIVALHTQLDRGNIFAPRKAVAPGRCDVYNISDVTNNTGNHHGIKGYLSDPLVARSILLY